MTDSTHSRGRDAAPVSTGRGGRGNILDSRSPIRQSIAEAAQVIPGGITSPATADETAHPPEAEYFPSDRKGISTGRGGMGNIVRSPSHSRSRSRDKHGHGYGHDGTFLERIEAHLHPHGAKAEGGKADGQSIVAEEIIVHDFGAEDKGQK